MHLGRSETLPSLDTHLLCVDDDCLGLYLRGCIFEKHGYSVTSVSDPIAALSLDISTIALAVFGFNMPNLNGLDLLREMQQHRQAHFPIILLAAGAEDLPLAVRSSFSACFDKCRPSKHLLEAIASLLLQKAPVPPSRPADHGPSQVDIDIAHLHDAIWPRPARTKRDFQSATLL